MTATWTDLEPTDTEPIDPVTDVPYRQLGALARVFYDEAVARQWAYTLVGTLGVVTILAAVGWTMAAIITPLLAIILTDLDQTEERAQFNQALSDEEDRNE
jgi:hypothetical protein